MAKLADLVTDPNNLTALVEDCATFCAVNGLDATEAGRAASFSTLVGSIVQRTPMTLTDITEKVNIADLIGAKVSAAEGFTDAFVNKFDKSYTNSKGFTLIDQLGLNIDDFDVGKVGNLNVFEK